MLTMNSIILDLWCLMQVFRYGKTKTTLRPAGSNVAKEIKLQQLPDFCTPLGSKGGLEELLELAVCCKFGKGFYPSFLFHVLQVKHGYYSGRICW